MAEDPKAAAQAGAGIVKTGEHRDHSYLQSLCWGPKGFPSELSGGSVNDLGEDDAEASCRVSSGSLMRSEQR